ncbi:hypothetical protein MMC07_008730 [Pseudocyphellaria aurata]|nr:hypothetical protein [Pseudocyphellaria aurata]
MGKGSDLLEAFIEKIPDSKLIDLRSKSGKIYSDNDFRLDMQGMTTGSESFNLQIQINKQTTISYMRKVSGKTVRHVLVPIDADWTAEEVRAKLRAATA